MSAEFDDFKKLRDRLGKYPGMLNQAYKAAVNEIVARTYSSVVKLTPVGNSITRNIVEADKKGRMRNKKFTVHQGGTLRQGWTFTSAVKQGNVYTAEIVNPVDYASYVEFGHRTRNHRGWVKGQFMLTKTEQAVRAKQDKIIEKTTIKVLKELLDGN
jgi:hypothetical protein